MGKTENTLSDQTTKVALVDTLSKTDKILYIVILGMLTAFVVSLFVIKYLMAYVKKHDFKIFGYYRIILGIVVLLYFGI